MAGAHVTPGLHSLDGRQWDCVDWISDLHLHVSEPRTARAFLDYLSQTPAQALFVLGDLFEVWVGDDVLHDPSGDFEQACVQALAAASRRLALFWLPGNRDFLTGSDFVRAIGGTLLDECCVLRLASEVCLMCHGDALCLQDQAYMAFRRQVRSSVWQSGFLARTLAQRQALARQMRAESQAMQAGHASGGDVDRHEVLRLLRLHGASRLIHGHTHRPAEHDLGHGLTRSVLSDWCLDAEPQRAQVLRWQAGPAPGWHRLPVSDLVT